jgi:hypothetical protein
MAQQNSILHPFLALNHRLERAGEMKKILVLLIALCVCPVVPGAVLVNNGVANSCIVVQKDLPAPCVWLYRN